MDFENNKNTVSGENKSDSYDVLHKNFNLFGSEPEPQEESDVKNSGEIYFSANDDTGTLPDGSEYDLSMFSDEPKVRTSQTSSNYVRSASSLARQRSSSKKQSKASSKASSGSSSGKKKKKKKKASAGSLIFSLAIVAFVIAMAFIVRIPVLGCMNDVLAIDRSDTEIRLILDKNVTTSELLDMLDDKGLIYSANFCKLISRFLGYSQVKQADGSYIDREYSGQEQSIVTVTFPEGYTIDQIVDRLVLNGVASEKALYDVLDSETFFEEFEFLSFIENKAYRYRNLEGYLYPDTYEFYYGENPESVIRKFLSNFSDKWSEKFAALAEESDYNIDEILTVASILQKEASDADQMKVISSIIYNRLESSSFPFINCDSTANYIIAHEKELKEIGSYVTLRSHYDTYQITGLPVGPICNPGEDAIAAAVSPAKTSYYYFLHDAEGNIYLASTAAEHEYNQRYLGN